MEEERSCEVTAENAGLLQLGIALGQNQAFAMVAGRCSAAQADAIRRIRTDCLYKKCTEKWQDFCAEYLKMSRSEADKIVRLLEEFGPAYFEVSQLTRVSPEGFRAVAPAIHDGALHHNGEAIELNPENSRKVAAAVAELRRAIPPKRGAPSFIREMQQIGAGPGLVESIEKLSKSAAALLEALERIADDPNLEPARWRLTSLLMHVHTEIGRILYKTN